VSQAPLSVIEPPTHDLRSVEAPPTRGLVYTFYSYKGGVGRSMALANAGALLAKSGQRVLMVDWDLEAPGLERFFRSASLSLSRTREETPGVVDLIWSVTGGTRLSWRDCLIDIIPQTRTLWGALSLITAGKLGELEGDDYVQRLRKLDWAQLFGEYRLGEHIEEWRSEWIRSFDLVLIDSRTGISDIGNISTILFPDVLILVFTTSGQSIDGIVDVMRRSRAAQAALPVDRGRLAAVPLLSRDEREKENELSLKWRKDIASALGEFYRDWLPPHVTSEDVLRKLYIPQIAYWSFGERLPVIEREEEMSDARSIASAYVRLARFMQYQLDWTKIEGDESAFVEVVKRAEEELSRAEEQRRSAEEIERRLRVEQREVAIRRNTSLYRLFVNFVLLFVFMFVVLTPELTLFFGLKWLPDVGGVRIFFIGAAGSVFAEILSASSARRPSEYSPSVIMSLFVDATIHLFVGALVLVISGYNYYLLGSPSESFAAPITVGLSAGAGINFMLKTVISRRSPDSG
jgi:cellulose biosynthesis protein BcsQ